MKKLLSLIFIVSSQLTFAQKFINPLAIPPTLTGKNFALTFDESIHQFYSGHNTNTYGVNGSYLGPTLILNQGDIVKISVTNNLADTTSCHWHGLHVPPIYDGGPHTPILPGENWPVTFKVMDKAATYWYHPHLHMKTEKQVIMGLAGLIIIKDTVEAKLNLPRTYNVDDFPLILQDHIYDENYQFLMTNTLGDSMMVNGTVYPYLNCPKQVVRLRVVNASPSRVYNLGFNDNRNFKVIASDASLLSAPYDTNRFLLSNGERVEILLDLSTDPVNTNLVLMSYGSTIPGDVAGGPMSGMIGGSGPLEAADFDVLQIRVQAQTSSPVTTIPSSLITHTPWTEASADRVRKKIITGNGSVGELGHFMINDTSYSMDYINDTVFLDDIEIWEFENKSNIAHPIHLHDVPFYILKRNGNDPPVYERGLKDVFLIRRNETVKFITKFTNFTDEHMPYMYHCHNLRHEDMGMMLQFIVLENPNKINEISDTENDLVVYPNPTSGMVYFNIDFSETRSVIVSVVNMWGQEVVNKIYTSTDSGKQAIDFSDLSSGIYFMKTSGDKKVQTMKIIVSK